ncbi:MAG: M20/M25/M40 family metallo-hydrolase [Acidobacteria bacterium]|nr:M20/M25/M40 family metallo-hydrolase [Acidobacteriota bacterium]
MSAADHNRIVTLAADRAVHQAFRWLHLHEPQMRRWQMDFLAIPAPPFQEADRAAWFRDQLHQLGLANAHIDAEGNAIAELQAPGSTGAEDLVLLSAHLDTVFPAGTDCRPREDGPRILCPGACDNGAGLTALLAIASALVQARIKPVSTIVFSANVGEEGEGDLRGMRYLFSNASPYAGRIRCALALEGAGDTTVVDRALGSRRLRVRITGPGGHSWADAGRPNPIMALATALVELGRLTLPAKPRTTLNYGIISGGSSVNSIPERASADLDLRSTSALELDRLELAVLNTLSRVFNNAETSRSATPLKLHVERIGNRASGILPPTSPLFTSLRAVDRHLGLTTETRIGSTDANLPLSIGIPALAIGAGGSGSGIHTLQESYDPTGRELALRRILLLLLDACSLTASAAAQQRTRPA